MATTTNLELDWVETRRTTVIAIADVSTYATEPTNTTLEITAPGHEKVVIQFVPRVVNVFGASTLNVECDNDISLPDGIYTFKYSIYPNTVNYIERSFMYTKNIEGVYERTFLSINASCECNGDLKSKFKQQLADVRLLIDGSISAANQCDSVTAYDMYKKAESILRKINPCNC